MATGELDARKDEPTVAGIALLDQAAERCGNRLEKAHVDQGFKDAVIIHGAVPGITVDVGKQPRGQGLRAATQEVGGRAGHRHADTASAPGARVQPSPRELGGPRLLGGYRVHGPPTHGPRLSLARHQAGRVNVSDLLRHLQATTHTENLQRQIVDLTVALVRARAHLTELQTAYKVVEGISAPVPNPAGAGYLPAPRGPLQRLPRSVLSGP